VQCAQRNVKIYQPGNTPASQQGKNNETINQNKYLAGSSPIYRLIELLLLPKRSSLADIHICEKQTILSWRIKCYSQKIKLDSTHADLYLLRAAAYTQSKIYTGARNDFLMAYGLGKNDPSVAQSIAFVYTRLGMADSAASWFFISGNPECCKQ